MPHERYFTDSEIAELLERAEALGFSMEKGSELEKMTLAEIERMLETRQ